MEKGEHRARYRPLPRAERLRGSARAHQERQPLRPRTRRAARRAYAGSTPGLPEE